MKPIFGFQKIFNVLTQQKVIKKLQITALKPEKFLCHQAHNLLRRSGTSGTSSSVILKESHMVEVQHPVRLGAVVEAQQKYG